MDKLKRLFWMVLAYFGLPGDFHWWYTVVFPALGAGMLDVVLVYIREAPLWEVLPIFVVLFVVFLVGIAWLRKPRASATPTSSPSSTYNIENVYLSPQNRNQSPAERVSAVAKEYNRGPVSIPEDKPYVADHFMYIGDSTAPVVCLVPYKPYKTVNGRFDNPATTIKVEDPEDAYLVVVSYEVRSFAEHSSASSPTMPIRVRAQVLDEGTKVVENLDIHEGDVHIAPDGSWRHVVSGEAVLYGLPKGVYGLNVLDYTSTFDRRENARREYREMRLRVARQ